MYNKTIIEFGFRMISWIIKTSCLCYLPQPSASADNTDLGFDNSWYHAQPHLQGIVSRLTNYMYMYKVKRPKAAFKRARNSRTRSQALWRRSSRESHAVLFWHKIEYRIGRQRRFFLAKDINFWRESIGKCKSGIQSTRVLCMSTEMPSSSPFQMPGSDGRLQRC